MSKKLSGAESRKRKREREEVERSMVKNITKLSAYYKPVTPPKVNEGASSSATTGSDFKCDDSDVQHEKLPTMETEEAESIDSTKASTISDSLLISSPPLTTITTDENKMINIINSSDKADFADFLSPDEKRLIIKIGPCQPRGPFPKDKDGRNKHRGFDEKWYYKIQNDGQIKLKRQWLCYSSKQNICYCQPCWLFDSLNSDLSFVKGTADWAHLGRNIEKHEESHQHAISCEVYYRWETDTTIDADNLREIKNMHNYWRMVLRRIVDVTITLATNDLPFRAHRIVDDEITSKGNFLEIIRLLARYDDVLAELLKRPKGAVNYLSPEIQNEVIQLLADEINIEIKDEMKESPFISIIMDTTQDVAKIDQLSSVFRYVVIKKDDQDKPIQLEIKETFCGFTEVHSQTSENLENLVLKIIEDFAELSKLRGQGYDGAANMSGIYSGLQTRLKQRNPAARYVHCCAHNLNLVVNDSVSNIQEIRHFYDQLEALYVFFSSVRRWSMLMTGTSSMTQTLKRVCPTRWSSRIQALDALRSRFFDVLKILTYLSLKGKNHEERQQAQAMKKYFEEFPTIILIILQNKILGSVDAVSKMLQGNQDVEKATEMLSSLISHFSSLRNNWEQMKNDAIELAVKWKVLPYFPNKRLHRVRKMFDEHQADDRIEDFEKRFQVEVFNRNIDIIVRQLTSRFESLREICTNFKCLSPRVLVTASDKDLLERANLLVESYPTDISPGLGSQLQRLKVCFCSHLQKLSSIREVTELIVIHSQASSSFPDVITACLIFLTIPVTTATAERTFSKLKLIKNYLRSSMSQHRLSALATISIERERARQLDFDQVIDKFARQKARKKEF